MDAQNISSPASIDTVDWEACYWEWLPRVYSFFLYRTGDIPLAEDLTSITFAKVWRARAQYSNDVSAFSTWLFTTAHHVAVDHFRSQRSQLSLNLLLHLADDSRPLDELIQCRNNSARLTVLVNQLPHRDRELIALKYGAELTNRAIAKLTGMSESNVGTSLHRIVNKLRVQWDQAK